MLENSLALLVATLALSGPWQWLSLSLLLAAQGEQQVRAQLCSLIYKVSVRVGLSDLGIIIKVTFGNK